LKKIAILLLVVTFNTPGVAAQQDTTLNLPALEQPVEILVDHWGISHIYAETEHDLFFAQGWNAARDRLFQATWIRN
jgi:penicillin amidase